VEGEEKEKKREERGKCEELSLHISRKLLLYYIFGRENTKGREMEEQAIGRTRGVGEEERRGGGGERRKRHGGLGRRKGEEKQGEGTKH